MKRIAYIKKKILALIMPIFLATMNFWVKTDERTILFLAFDGRGFLDNPKAIFDAMITDEKFEYYHLVWVLNQLLEIPGGQVIKKKSFAYYYYLSKA